MRERESKEGRDLVEHGDIVVDVADGDVEGADGFQRRRALVGGLDRDVGDLLAVRLVAIEGLHRKKRKTESANGDSRWARPLPSIDRQTRPRPLGRQGGARQANISHFSVIIK